MYGTSSPQGKNEIRNFLKMKLKPSMSICDVGPGKGTYYNLLGPDYEWTGVEIWHDTVKYISNFYDIVYEGDIINFWYPKHYDLVIFGDVIEHLTIKDAQECIARAKLNSNMIMIAIPYQYKQEPIYGNKAEKHIQDDLTAELFNERYPGFKLIFERKGYAYYFWSKDE